MTLIDLVIDKKYNEFSEQAGQMLEQILIRQLSEAKSKIISESNNSQFENTSEE